MSDDGAVAQEIRAVVETLRRLCDRMGRDSHFLRDGEFAGALGALEIAARG